MDDISSIIDAIKESIVVIKLPNQGRGSGFFVNDKGLFITNKHTVELDTFVKTQLYNNQEVESTVVYADNDIDFAFCLANVNQSRPIPLADSNTIKEGEPVVAIGHPYGYDFTVSKGIISCKKRTVKGINYIQTDVPINPGNSGGPLINAKGEAIGINTWVVGEADNMSFAIPVNSIKEILNHLNNIHSKLLEMYYCPVCGYLSDEFIKTTKAEYCKNCGAQKIEKKKEPAPESQEQPVQKVKVGLKVCPKCKTSNDSSANFCKNCGTKF
ncbi:MAG: trypsin-like peptidase domain-containing protein [candidate division WOR-3 bacterium]